MVLSAAIDKRRIAERHWGPYGSSVVDHDADAIVIVDHENVDDDRRRHQDDMRGGRQQGHAPW